MNKNLECIEINWSILGAKLASLSDVEQSQFLKAFAREMNRYDTMHQRDMQLASILSGSSTGSVKFTDDEKEIFEFLGFKDQ